MRTHVVTHDFIEDVDELLVTLVKNAAHCYGVNFQKLNECLIACSSLLREGDGALVAEESGNV